MYYPKRMEKLGVDQLVVREHVAKGTTSCVEFRNAYYIGSYAENNLRLCYS